MALRLQGRWMFRALARAFNAIIHRHEALRTTLVYQDGELIQKIAPDHDGANSNRRF